MSDAQLREGKRLHRRRAFSSGEPRRVFLRAMNGAPGFYVRVKDLSVSGMRLEVTMDCPHQMQVGQLYHVDLSDLLGRQEPTPAVVRLQRIVMVSARHVIQIGVRFTGLSENTRSAIGDHVGPLQLSELLVKDSSDTSTGSVNNRWKLIHLFWLEAKEKMKARTNASEDPTIFKPLQHDHEMIKDSIDFQQI